VPRTQERSGEELATVAIVGGGYGGAAAAKALDDIADVILIEPKDAFVHNIAALRGLIDPEWTDRVFYPYTRLLSRGKVIHDRAVRIDADAVTLGSGERIAADYIVLASGSTYPFPAKMDVNDSTIAKSKIANTRAELIKADRVLLLGAGPVGLELSGEIKAAWPDKAVTVIDPIDDVLSGQYSDAMRKELRRQLEELGVNLLLGSRLTAEPPTPRGVASTFTAVTTSGEITADIWFRCYGIVPNSDYLSEELASARLANGHLEVTPELRLAGQQSVFAIGDLTAIPEAKRGGAASRHAEVVADNIRALIEGRDDLTAYQPAPPLILLPLGPTGGVSQLPGQDDFAGPEMTAQIKGQDLFVGRYAELFNLS